MKVASTVDFTEADRRHGARFLGTDGLASHIQCVAWAAQQIRVSLTVMATAALKPRPDNSVMRDEKAEAPHE